MYPPCEGYPGWSSVTPGWALARPLGIAGKDLNVVDRSLRPAGLRRGVTVAISLVAAFTLGLTGVSAASAATPAGPTSYPGAVPSWATAVNDQGAADPAVTFEAEIYLPLRNAAAAQALATVVSTPGVGYRAGLSAAQWISRFAPSKADSDETVAFLADAERRLRLAGLAIDQADRQ